MKVFTCLIAILIVLGIVAVGAFIFMLAWNAFATAVFGWPAINYGTAFAGWFLLAIVGSFFRSITSGKS